MKSKFLQFMGIEILAITFGFLAAFVTGMVVTPEKAMTLPGGSLSVGLAMSFIFPRFVLFVGSFVCQFLFLITLALAGLGGWLIYIAVFS